MSTIIASRFASQPQVQDAIHALHADGFSPEQICAFYVNPPGQHHLYPIGGDGDRSPGAEGTAKGAAAGAAAGATVGLIGIPVIGPAAALVGAYVGSLMGGMASTREQGEMPQPEVPCEHPSGLLLAVATEGADQRARAIAVLQTCGGFDLEEAQGLVEHGDWVDFDPRRAPRLLQGAALHRRP